MQILDIQNATVYRGRNKVFEDLNLGIEVGAHTAIIGPNGAGKTTLLKVLAREIYPSGGTVKIYGKCRWNVWDLRKHLGIVSADLQQNYAAHAHGSAVVRSGFYASIDTFGHQSFTHDQIETASRLARELEIEHLSETPFSQMSTGEQRRHLLARALVHNPETLVLDEPTTGLDLTAQFQYLETVRGLMKSGKTLILVTHHIHEIPPEIDEIVLIKNGVVVLKEKKDNAMTDQNLSELFDVPVKVVSNNGFYHVAPA
jgi:iron complex transport system ATP-binding protein